MFREIRTTEKITDTCVVEEHHEFEQIKPETEMTTEEAKDFWNELFGF